MRVFSTYSLLNVQSLAIVSVYSTAKSVGCFHFCVVSLQSMVSDVVSAIVSFYVRGTPASCWHPLLEIARLLLQSRSRKMLNMDNEPYSKLRASTDEGKLLSTTKCSRLLSVVDK